MFLHLDIYSSFKNSENNEIIDLFCDDINPDNTSNKDKPELYEDKQFLSKKIKSENNIFYIPLFQDYNNNNNEI